MMLRHLDQEKAPLALGEAFRAMGKIGKPATRDLGGTATTREMADAIKEQLTRA